MSLRILLLFALAASSTLAQSATTSITGNGSITGTATLNVLPASSGGNTLIPAALGWYSIPNSNISTLCPPFSELTATTGCPAVESAWGSAIFDTLRGRYCISGGGHNDYYGNEIYCLQMNSLGIALAHQPTHNPNLGTIVGHTETYLNGQMAARHPFSGVWYHPQLDFHFILGAGLPNNGDFSDFYYKYDPTADTYTQFSQPTPHPSPNAHGSEPACGYDRVTWNIYCWLNNDPSFWIGNMFTNTWTNPVAASGNCNSKTNPSSVVDPVHRIYLTMGQGCMQSIGLDSPWTRTNLTPASCATPMAPGGPGLDFDTSKNLIGMWVGGNTFYTYDPIANVCTPVTFTAGPGSALTQGTRNLLQYDPADGVHLLSNGTTNNIFSLRLTNQQTLAQADWITRSTASGVIVARQLSTSADLTPGVYSFPNPNPAVALNCTTFTSGGCSIEFTISTNGGANAAGSVSYPFSTSGTGVGQVNFGQNSDFYVQYRISMDTPYLTQTYKDGSGTKTYQKLHILHWGDFPTKNFSTCGQIESTAIYPIPFEMYGQCGADLYAPPYAGGTNFLLESGTKSTALGDAYNQGYNYNYLAPHGSGIVPLADTWYTVYIHVHVGTFGSPNSHIDAWWSTPGGDPRQWINYTTTMNQDSPSINAYNYATLLPYMTNRSSSFPVALPAHVRYNELIVSSNPIANPWGPIGQP